MALRLTIRNDKQHRQFDHSGGPLELGRGPRRIHERFVVKDRYVSRDQVRIEELPDATVQLHNVGREFSLADGSRVPQGEARRLPLPAELTIGCTHVAIDYRDDPFVGPSDSPLQTIARPVQGLDGAHVPPASPALGPSPSQETLTRWFETLLSVQKAVAGSGEFYQETARAVVEMVGLDRGLVLLRRGEAWEVVAAFDTEGVLGSQFSRAILQHVVDHQRTFFQDLSRIAATESLAGVEAVVASPIFDVQNNVLGIVYGSRSQQAGLARHLIRPLEAQVVQLLAAAVSAGFARLEKEAEAARRRVQLEQFFSPELMSALERNPQLLDGHQREVTILFSDLRGFSQISQRIGVRENYQLLSDVMDRLTNRVIEQGGVIIDYYGDGLAAMWNAPIDQTDHAARACRAGLAMLGELPAVNQRWAQVAGCPLKIGIGIHTGTAQVGNAGSQRRMKYGPRGHAVNLASRVEGATKHLGVPALITRSTHDALPPDWETRRVCSARVVGVKGAVELFELSSPVADSHGQRCRQLYQQALEKFESAELQEASRLLAELQAAPDGRDDAAGAFLAHQIRRHQNLTSEPFDPVLWLDSK